MIAFTIDVPPRTKKNHQNIYMNSKTGKRFVSTSDAYKAYEAAALMLIPKKACLGIDYPVNIKCLYYMDSHRRCDLINLLEATDDVLVKAGVIGDDNYKIVAGHDGSRVLYDHEHPRTEIEITRMGD